MCLQVYEQNIQLVNGLNNGSFRVDTASSTGGILFSFYSLEENPGWIYVLGSLYSPSGSVVCNIVRIGYNFYAALCPNNPTIIEVYIIW